MERRLHPDFTGTRETPNSTVQTENRIQTHFDPTPHSLKKELPQNQTDSEFETETKLKLARASQKFSLIEKRLDHFINETHLNISKMASRLNEKSLQESKIESLVERHNQVLLSFEKRMAQLAKYLEEKDSHIMLLQGQLEESRKELFRLKRL